MISLHISTYMQPYDRAGCAARPFSGLPQTRSPSRRHMAMKATRASSSCAGAWSSATFSVRWDLLHGYPPPHAGFFPFAVAFVWTYYRPHPLRRKLWALAVIALQPPLLLIDHGHFQYNAISLGLTVRT